VIRVRVRVRVRVRARVRVRVRNLRFVRLPWETPQLEIARRLLPIARFRLNHGLARRWFMVMVRGWGRMRVRVRVRVRVGVGVRVRVKLRDDYYLDRGGFCESVAFRKQTYRIKG